MRQNQQSAEAESGDLPVDFAFWDVPGSTAKVLYSLPLFHEIDFVVNEGYRKVPHGGIEVGGILFGTVEKEVVRIEAFRPLECEHASGPSLNLSERDLAALEQQLKDAATDRDLEKLQPVGWFLAHTRGPMEMTEAEVKHFARFFPEPFRVTVLVKPERFQPTRFVFLVRNQNNEIPREATSQAVILPLPGRSHKAGQLVPSIPAPATSNAAKRAMQKASLEEELEEQDEQAAEPTTKATLPKAQESAGIWKTPAPSEAAPAEFFENPPERFEENDQAQPEESESRTPAERAARKQLSRDRARVMEQAFAETAVQPQKPVPVHTPFRPAPLPSLPLNAIRPVANAHDREAANSRPEQQATAAGDRDAVLSPRSLTALAVASLLGCLVGYIAYLQLPAPVIAIDVRPVNQNVLVSWPPDETRNAIYAAIRLDDGTPVPLSANEKKTGQISLTAAKDFKAEVMARNWIRDSRGIVHYMRSSRGNGQVLPSDLSRLP